MNQQFARNHDHSGNNGSASAVLIVKIAPKNTVYRSGYCGGCNFKYDGHWALNAFLAPHLSCQLEYTATAKNKYRKLEANIPRKEIVQPQSQFPHSCVCELFRYAHDRYILRQEICEPILGIYKSITDIRMLKLGMRPRNFQKRNT